MEGTGAGKALMPPPPPRAPRAPVTPVKSDAVNFQMATTANRHSMLVKAFDHLNHLEVNGLANDQLHEQLMQSVSKAIGPEVGTQAKDDIGVHVYNSTPELVMAGIVNIKSRHEIILTIHRNNKKSLIYKKRFLKNKPSCADHDLSALKLLSDAAGSRASNEK